MNQQHFQELCRAFSKIQTVEEAEKFLRDILTPQELESIAERLQIVKLLAKGMPHRKVAAKLGVSISKTTRGSRVLQFGTSGFSLILKRIKAI